MKDCGLWNTLVCHSSSLKTTTLTPGRYIDKFLEIVVCLAYNVTNARIHAEKANLSPFVIVRIEDDGCEDFYLDQYLAVMDRPTHLDVLRQYSRKGCDFKLVERRKVLDVKEGSVVQMEWRKHKAVS